jgi:hypothetical protein
MLEFNELKPTTPRSVEPILPVPRHSPTPLRDGPNEFLCLDVYDVPFVRINEGDLLGMKNCINS